MITSSQPISPLKHRLVEIVALSAALGLGFLIVNYLHFRFLPVHVILYAGIMDLLVAFALILAGWYFLRRSVTHLSETETGLTVIASALLVLFYTVMGPTVIDRSLSIYIVQKLDARGGEIAQDAMSDVFIKEYMPEFRLMDVRLTEQVSSGTARIEDGCVRLTSRGRLISAFANFYRKNFLPRRRVLLGEETDQLTDPFSGTPQIVDTSCPEPDQR